MKDATREVAPATVNSERDSKQAGDIRARWAWVEPAVWSDRMLAALEEGVKGGVWFSLVDKLWAPQGWTRAWERVRVHRGAAGVDGETVEQFSRHAEERLTKLSDHLQDGAYQPLPVRRVFIPKSDGRRRPLGIPAVCDRIVQTALRNVLEPIFEAEFCEHSYGTTFGPLDGWLRMRLRSILRRRIKLRGRGRGADHQRRPNAYFAREGLFTMLEAYRLARQSVAAH